MLNKLTVIIFSYNKKKELIRAIEYWNKFDLSVVILDGSDKRLNDSFLSNDNIKYIHDPRSLYDRLLSSINYIKTEFVVLCCDDVFYLPSALKSCINFLAENPSFSSCGGLPVCFGKINKTEFYGREAYPNLRRHSLEQESPIARVKKHFSNYEIAHLYSIIRRNDWEIICKTVFEKEYKFFAAFELQIEFLVPASGKTKIINELFALKDLDPGPIRGTNPSMDLSYDIFSWWLKNDKKNERYDFFLRMSQAFKKLSKNQISNCNEEMVFQIFKIYFNSNNTIKVKFAKYIPKVLKDVLKIVFNFIKNKKKIYDKKTKKTFSAQINELENQGVIVNHKDIKNVFSVIVK